MVQIMVQIVMVRSGFTVTALRIVLTHGRREGEAQQGSQLQLSLSDFSCVRRLQVPSPLVGEGSILFGTNFGVEQSVVQNSLSRRESLSFA